MRVLLACFALLICWSVGLAQDAKQTNREQADTLQVQRLLQDVSQANRQQADALQVQKLLHELEFTRMQAQTENLRRDAERINAEMRGMDLEAKQSKPDSIVGIAARSKAAREAEKMAGDASALAAEEKQIEAAKSADFTYLCIAISLPLILGFYLANRVKNVGNMKREEKFGILLMILAALIGLGVIAISDGWAPQYDALQNIMLTLRFRLFVEEHIGYSPAVIDVPTKYILLLLICVAAYGFTTYLGITPAEMKKSQTGIEPGEPKSEN